MVSGDVLYHHVLVCVEWSQLAVTMQRLIELAGGLGKPHIICGDFNSWPGSPPYQLLVDGHLSDTSFTDLQAILTIDSGDTQVSDFSQNVRFIHRNYEKIM